MKKSVFKNFADYWFYAKFLSSDQREVILSNLPDDQREDLLESYKDGGWEDLVVRNEIDKLLEEVKSSLNIDLLEIRCKVLSGKSVYIKKSKWDYIIDIFGSFKPKHNNHILGNLFAQQVDDDTVLIIERK